MAGQNTFKILLLNDANMIGEHQETKMKMLNECPFEKITFLPRIDTNSDTFEIANLALLTKEGCN